MTRFNRPTVTGGSSFARYNYKWSNIGVELDTKRLAVVALTALYGKKAASAAIREARKVSGKDR